MLQRELIPHTCGNWFDHKNQIAQLTLHASPAVLTDRWQIPKSLGFLLWGTYDSVLDLNVLCPVEGMLYCSCAQPIYLSYHSYISIGVYIIRYHQQENLNSVIT